MKKRLAAVCTALIMTAMFLASCSCAGTPDKLNSNTSVVEQNATEETNEVLSTTDGGTVEKDKEGNKLTRDSGGELKSVEDKNGNPVSVSEYLESHPEANTSSKSSSTSKSDSSKSTVSSKSKATKSSSSSNTSSKTSSKTSSETTSEGVEEEIPVVIADVPDDEELETIDFD